jgi:hypothetical protein
VELLERCTEIEPANGIWVVLRGVQTEQASAPFGSAHLVLSYLIHAQCWAGAAWATVTPPSPPHASLAAGARGPGPGLPLLAVSPTGFDFAHSPPPHPVYRVLGGVVAVVH